MGLRDLTVLSYRHPCGLLRAEEVKNETAIIK